MYIDERFTNDKLLWEHYKKHRDEFDFPLTKKEYEILAEDIQDRKVDNKEIFGYISDKNGLNKLTYCKYDKVSGVFVSYYYKGDEPITTTCFPQNYQQYLNRKEKYYVKEIPEGE